jgi:hypothetical protein
MNKSERQRGRMAERKLKLAGGDHRLAQVFIRPEVFSIHMKGLKIRARVAHEYLESLQMSFIIVIQILMFYLIIYNLWFQRGDWGVGVGDKPHK